MKSILSVCIIAGSALVAGSTFTYSPTDHAVQSTSYFTCNIDGNTFTAVNKQADDTALATKFTYADDKQLLLRALFIIAEKNGSCFYIQPVDDDAPAALLTAHTNLYNNFNVTYRAANNIFYNSTDAPGNLEITSIDNIHKVITGKLNCILYSSTQEDWLLITNGKFSFKF